MRKMVFAIALLVAACSGGSMDPRTNGVQEAGQIITPNFLTANPGAPGLMSDTVQFYAVPGQDRSGSLYYTDSTLFLSFDVPPNALPPGDSVLITIALDDSTHLISGFSPAGLQFVNGHPAELTLSFVYADSGLSSGNEAKLSLWGQEHPGQNWHKVSSQLNKQTKTVTGRIEGFTVYATAY